MKLYDTGVYLQNGQEIIPENQANLPVAKEEAAKNTIAYSILKAHNKSDNMEKLQIKFDKKISLFQGFAVLFWISMCQTPGMWLSFQIFPHKRNINKYLRIETAASGRRFYFK